MAGPIEGELFGYRLGSRYPATDDTKGGHHPLGSALILAEKPTDFQRVEIIATPKTFTIVNIDGIAEFSDEKQAEALAAQYPHILDTVHGNKCRQEKSFLSESLKRVCGGQYELRVNYFGLDKTDEKHKVHVGLTFDNMSKAKKQINTQMDQEIKALEAEGKCLVLNRQGKSRGCGISSAPAVPPGNHGLTSHQPMDLLERLGRIIEMRQRLAKGMTH